MAAKVIQRDFDPDDYRKMFGPGHADQMVHQAIQTCWMVLPKNRKTVADLEKEFRRLVDRAFQNLKEDELRLGPGGE